MTDKIGFAAEMSNFVFAHKLLCVLTLGTAALVYGVGKLGGRAFRVIAKCFKTTKKVDAQKEKIGADHTPIKKSNKLQTVPVSGARHKAHAHSSQNTSAHKLNNLHTQALSGTGHTAHVNAIQKSACVTITQISKAQKQNQGTAFKFDLGANDNQKQLHITLAYIKTTDKKIVAQSERFIIEAIKDYFDTYALQGKLKMTDGEFKAKKGGGFGNSIFYDKHADEVGHIAHFFKFLQTELHQKLAHTHAQQYISSAHGGAHIDVGGYPNTVHATTIDLSHLLT